MTTKTPPTKPRQSANGRLIAQMNEMFSSVINYMDEKFTAINARFDKIDNEVADIKTELEIHGTKLDRLERWRKQQQTLHGS